MTSFNMNEHISRISRNELDTANFEIYASSSDDENDELYLKKEEVEGEETGISRNIGDTPITPFNLREEMEDGHFDKNDYFIWHEDGEIQDNWLKTLDEQPIKIIDRKLALRDAETELKPFEEIELFKKILTFMRPNESINTCLTRLGKNGKKLSSIERLKLKKAGLLVTNNEVVELTGLTNEILINTGNINIYEETFESIVEKIASV